MLSFIVLALTAKVRGVPLGTLVFVFKTPVGLTTTYAYDSNSNRLSKSSASGTVTSTYNSQDELVTMGTVNYTYDANEQLISKLDTSTGNTTTYQYDVFGNLIAVTLPNGNVVSYILDGKNRRMSKSINNVLSESYVYLDDLRIGARITATNPTVEVFIYADKQNVPEGVFVYGLNGSYADVRVVVDERGTPKLAINNTKATPVVIEQIDTDEFGNVLSDTNPGYYPFGFAGCLYDQDTKLCHFGAREYDPEVGRWLQRDPILFQGGSTNLYGYVLNDPINATDITGTVSCTGSPGLPCIPEPEPTPTPIFQQPNQCPITSPPPEPPPFGPPMPGGRPPSSPPLIPGPQNRPPVAIVIPDGGSTQMFTPYQ